MVFAIASIIVLLISVGICGHGWVGVPISISISSSLFSGILGILIGAGVYRCIWLVSRPRIFNRIRLRALSALIAGIYALVFVNVATGFLFSWLPFKGDEESLLYSLFLQSALSAFIALFFGFGLGQPDWREEL